MAKGLGGIMAELAMREEARRLKDLETIACPFCGREMDNGGMGSVWFCYGGPPHEGKCERLSEIEEALGGAWEAQGTMVAAVVSDGLPIIECYVVRGRYGASNLSVSVPIGGDTPLEDVPVLVAAHNWTFLDEVAFIAGGES